MSDWDRCLLCGRIMRLVPELDGVCTSCLDEMDQIDLDRAAVYAQRMLGPDDVE